MRVLIAEDELLERKAMKKFIEDNFNHFTVVGEAPNGRIAIELAESTKPDIIFMDIKMPGINGLEAIKKITETLPDTRFILVSAYDSFDYAKQAMQFGVKEYILKPGKKDEIIQAIRRVEKEILQKRVQEAESEQIVKEHLITKLMEHPVQEDAIELQKKHFPNIKSGFFLVIQAREQDVRRIVEKHVEHVLFTKNGDHCIICVLAPSSIEKADILELCRKLYLELGKETFIGAGYPYFAVDDLPKSYLEAFTACDQLVHDNNRRYGFVQEVKARNSIQPVISSLLENIEKGNIRESLLVFQDNQDAFRPTDKEELYFNIRKMLLERNISPVKNSIAELCTNNDWQTFIRESCLQLREYHHSKKYISKAKKYINDNYQQALTLEGTAAFVGLSPNYFSNLFRQELGQTFIDYVTNVRMDKAKELMEKNTYSLKEVSYMVGYKDPNYFSRVFKKHNQISPKRFQQDILKK